MAVRPHWQKFFGHLDAVAPEEMRRRLDFAERRIQENGVTYNVYADPNGADRPWALDPLPLIIPPDEWAEVSALSPSAPPAQRHAGRPLRPQTCSQKASCHRRWSMASTGTCGPAAA
jgi:hypothetical protein